MTVVHNGVSMDLTEFSETWGDWLEFIANQGEDNDEYLRQQKHDRNNKEELNIEDSIPQRHRSDGDYGP